MLFLHERRPFGGEPHQFADFVHGMASFGGEINFGTGIIHTLPHFRGRPLAQQMEFCSRLLKLNDDADIMEELKGLTPEQLKALIAMVKNV